MRSRVVPPSVLIAATLAIAGCAGDVGFDESGQIGVLEVPLESTGSQGAVFRLAGTFDLVGPETLTATVTATDMTAGDDVLSLNPVAGSYMLTLSNWTLYEYDPMTNQLAARPDAMLLNGATQAVHIVANQTTNTIYQFRVAGTGTVVFARGWLNVDFSVTQGYPTGTACTADVECLSHVCLSGACQAPSCNDGVHNGSEDGPDCGQVCGIQCPTVQCSEAGCPMGQFCIDNNGDAIGDSCSTTCNPGIPTSCPNQMLCLAGPTGEPICGALPCDPAVQGSCPPGLVCEMDPNPPDGFACHF